jgi:tetratricopeptide (TPR) repeat protein
VLGAAAVDESVIEMILVRGEGNPFFLEELARTVGELGGAESTLVVPATVHDVLLARIDRLPAMETHVLHVAAVIGKDAPLSLLREVAGLPEATLRQSLTRLRAAELLYETGLDAEPQYTFKHALTHDVAYANVGDRRRRELHDAIVTAMEGLHADRLADRIERLADHAFRAERWDKAAVHLRAAGLKAAERSALREAVACFERALLALQRLPESQGTLEQAIDLHFDVRVALQPLGQFAPMLEHLRAAERSAKALGDRRRLGLVLAYLTDYWRLMGDQDQALETGQQALALAEALGDVTLLIRANTYLGQVNYARGDYRPAASLFARNVAMLSGELSRERFGSPQPPSVHVRTCLVWCLAELGDFHQAAARAEEGLRIAESLGQPLSIATACCGLGHLYLRQGKLSRAIAPLERGLEASRSWNIRLWFPRVASALGATYALAGRVVEAVPLVEQAVEQSSAMRLMGNHALLVCLQGEVYLRAGRIGDAAVAGRHALDLSRHHKEAGHEAWARRLLGEVALSVHPSRPDEAEAHLAQALDQARRLGMRPLGAGCDLALGRACRARGDLAGAAGHLKAAAATFRDLEMPLGLSEAEAELGRLA